MADLAVFLEVSHRILTAERRVRSGSQQYVLERGERGNQGLATAVETTRIVEVFSSTTVGSDHKPQQNSFNS